MNTVFSSQQVVMTARNSLAARAVLRLGTICELGTVWISDAECIRWNAGAGTGEVCLGGSSGRWYAIVDNGMEMLARAEGLSWRRPDGSVFESFESDDRRVFLFFDSVCDCRSDMFEYETMDLRWCGCVHSESIYCLECGEQLGIAESDPCDCSAE
jgi:hypothetical protein